MKRPHDTDAADAAWCGTQLERVRDEQLDRLREHWRSHGPEDARTVALIENLAATLLDLGEDERARVAQESAFAAYRGELTPRDPRLLRAAWNLFRTHQRLGDTPRAMEVFWHHLAWILESEDADLDAETRRIRDWLRDWTRALSADPPG